MAPGVAAAALVMFVLAISEFAVLSLLRIPVFTTEVFTGRIVETADFGKFRGFDPINQQQQLSFIVMDYSGDPNSVEFGIGHGFTAGSDDLVLKLMLIHKF